jgi:PAS domain S-box-containing protein/putative nucleotidyltransferase with HDIG domain
MGIPLRTLIIEDSEDDALLVVRVLQKGGYDPEYECVETADAMREALEKGAWDIIISDYNMPHFSGPAALELYNEKGLDIPFIIVSGTIGEEAAVAAMVSGAHDYVMKNNLPRLIPAIQRELRDGESRRERKQAVEELYRTNELLTSIVENIPNMIFLKDAENLRFVRFNHAGEDLLGYSREDLLGKNDYDFFPKEQADFFTQNDREVLRGKKVVDIQEENLQTRNNGVRTLHTQKVPIMDVKGEPAYLLGISADITARKHAEENLKETTEKLRNSLIGTIKAMSLMVETRDPYTAGHQRRVSELARAIAQEMALSSDTVDTIRMAGIIHDIGKISAPAEILSKPSKLSDIEFSLIKVHPQSGYEILKDLGLPCHVAEMVLQHHERLNGSGYPQGLKNGQILFESQIIAIADVVEAMASHRPYRPALGIDVALEEIEKNKGILYDAGVVDVCVKLFREKRFIFE